MNSLEDIICCAATSMCCSPCKYGYYMFLKITFWGMRGKALGKAKGNHSRTYSHKFMNLVLLFSKS